MVNSTKFQLNFPYLSSLGIDHLDEIKTKLKFEGKINSDDLKNWHITGMSYNPSLFQLNLVINNGSDSFRIHYQEAILKYKGKRSPVIRAKNNIHRCDLYIKKQPIHVESKQRNITVFPLKKTS